MQLPRFAYGQYLPWDRRILRLWLVQLFLCRWGQVFYPGLRDLWLGSQMSWECHIVWWQHFRLRFCLLGHQDGWNLGIGGERCLTLAPSYYVLLLFFGSRFWVFWLLRSFCFRPMFSVRVSWYPSFAGVLFSCCPKGWERLRLYSCSYWHRFACKPLRRHVYDWCQSLCFLRLLL